MPVIKLLVFISHDGNRAHFVYKGEGLPKESCIVISVLCGIYSGSKLNQEKQGRNRRKIRKISGRMTSLI